MPNTLISTSKSDIYEFSQKCRSIAKPYKLNFIPPPLEEPENMISLMVNNVEPNEILNVEEDFLAAAPTIFQEEIDKEYELRVIAFKDDVEAYKIDSQRSVLGKLDWRRAQFENIYSRSELDVGLKLKVREYLRASELTYGIFDFVKCKNEKYWFLECNSDGQWAWLENGGDRYISEMFARNIVGILKE